MGQDIRPQLGFSVDVMLELVKQLEQDWMLATDQDNKDNLLGCMVYSTLSYVNALRGNEGFKLELSGLFRYIDSGRNHPKHPHCIAPLLGRFKGEDGERYHLLLLMTAVTNSGLEPQRMLDLLTSRRKEQGFKEGPAFVDSRGDEIASSVYEALILDALMNIKQREEEQMMSNQKRLLADVCVEERYGIFRSFKRGAITRAQEAGVKREDVEFMGRWRKIEDAQGRKPSRSIREHYTELTQMLEARLRFSVAL